MEGAKLPEAVAESQIVIRGFRGSILPYNPEKNEVSYQEYKYQALKAMLRLTQSYFREI